MENFTESICKEVNNSKSSDSGVVTSNDMLKNNSKVESNTLKSCKNNEENINNLKTSNITTEDSISIKSNTDSSIKSNGSQNIYINSINLNDHESYILSSDSDEEFDYNNCIIKKLGEHRNVSGNPMEDVQIVKQDINELTKQNGNTNQSAAVFSDAATNLNINNLSIAGNTSDVTVGNKYIFDGNVIIKQFVIEKQTPNGKRKEPVSDNLGFENDNYIDTAAESKVSTLNQSDNKNSTFLGLLDYQLKSYKNILIFSGTLILLATVLGIVGWKLDKKIPSNNLSMYEYHIGDGDDSRKNIPIDSTIGSDIIAPGQVLRIISRSEWIAQPPNVDLSNLTIPVHRIIIAHTATEPCDTQAQCTFRVRYIQTFHIESRGFDDIGYNFLVGGDGAVYEGRGWDKMGAHTKGYNVDSICVAFIGTFNTVVPPEGQLNAARLIIQEGLRFGKLSNNYKLYGHRQLIATESPGVALFQILQKWPHFATDLASINPIKHSTQTINTTASVTVTKNES